METLARIIDHTGGRIRTQKATYIAVSYTSKWLGFVDDVEFRLDQTAKKLHLRSASRVGYGDWGVNRQRIAQLKKHIDAALSQGITE